MAKIMELIHAYHEGDISWEKLFGEMKAWPQGGVKPSCEDRADLDPWDCLVLFPDEDTTFELWKARRQGFLTEHEHNELFKIAWDRTPKLVNH